MFWKVAIWAIFQAHTRAISCMIVVWEHFKHFLPFLCERTAHTRKKKKRSLAVMFVESISESRTRFSLHSLNYFSYSQIVEQLVNSHLDVVLKDNMINRRIFFVINVRCSHQHIAKAAPNHNAPWWHNSPLQCFSFTPYTVCVYIFSSNWTFISSVPKRFSQ